MMLATSVCVDTVEEAERVDQFFVKTVDRAHILVAGANDLLRKPCVAHAPENP